MGNSLTANLSSLSLKKWEIQPYFVITVTVVKFIDAIKLKIIIVIAHIALNYHYRQSNFDTEMPC